MTFKFYITTYGWGNNQPRMVSVEGNAEGMDPMIDLPIWVAVRFREWQQTDMRQPLEFTEEMRGGTGRFRCEMLS